LRLDIHSNDIYILLAAFNEIEYMTKSYNSYHISINVCDVACSVRPYICDVTWPESSATKFGFDWHAHGQQGTIQRRRHASAIT